MGRDRRETITPMTQQTKESGMKYICNGCETRCLLTCEDCPDYCPVGYDLAAGNKLKLGKENPCLWVPTESPTIDAKGEECSICRYWISTSGNFGNCRRRTPISIEENWPVTNSTDWCGEWTQSPTIDPTTDAIEGRR